jgi:hypothetical protein
MPSTEIAAEGTSRFSRIDSYDIELSSSLALRIYSNTNPQNSHIAELQKGLILVSNGVELIGEGTGFGVPVLLYSDETYFSGSSNLYFFHQNDSTIIRKEYFMDRVHRKGIGRLNLENRRLRFIRRQFYQLYQNSRHFRPLVLKTISSKMGINTSFKRVNPVGCVIVDYVVYPKTIVIKMNLDLLTRDSLMRILIMNEQGSTFLRRYSDSNGIELIDGQIGAWEIADAEWASITDKSGTAGFRMWKPENVVFRLGREYMKHQRDWIGLEYEISSLHTTFEYEIEILGV